MKRLWAWAGRNSRLLILVLFYLSFLAFIFYAINNVQINDTLLGVIIALLFPVFATFVNHLLKQDMEQRQWQREEAERAKAIVSQQRVELRLVYLTAMQHMGRRLEYTSLNADDMLELHEALAAFSLDLPTEAELDETTPDFTKAVKQFRDYYSLYLNDPQENSRALPHIADILERLSNSDPRIRPSLYKVKGSGNGVGNNGDQEQ